jgi:hypothetical protein
VAATIALIAAAVLAPVFTAPAAQAAGAVSIEYTFTYTGGPQYWTVPANVSAARFDVSGASGGGSALAGGGSGGQATGVLALTPGSTLQVNVGGAGGQGSAGWNGGGSPGLGYGPSHLGGGGGASDVRPAAGGLADRLIVAGGGGGAGYSGGGAGGGTAGSAGGSAKSAFGGGGGTQSAGGAGLADGCGSYNGNDGAFGIGGNGNDVNGAGAGGGGWYGGGSGTAGCWIGGGGGGSGHVTVDATSASMTNGSNAGNGIVSISYTGSILPKTTITSSGTPTLLGSVSYTAVIAGLPSSPVLTNAGTVTFSDGGTPIPTCSNMPVSNWSATCTLNYAEPGVHSIAAGYTGDADQDILPSTSTAFLEQVYRAQARFDYTGAAQTFTVPSGVTAGYFQVYGAAGGTAHGFYGGGPGGEADGLLTLQPGSDLQLNVGGAAQTPGGWNGGGTGGHCAGCGGGGGGGGASDVRTGAYGLSDRLIVGGGGGGGGSSGGGGGGGGLTGGDGVGERTDTNGSGGRQVVGGANGMTVACFPPLNGTPGTFGIGGDANPATDAGLGGGGGGGWYGGGAGGECGTGGAGGGGGSGYFTPTATLATLTPGVRGGNGFIVIWYTIVPQTTTTSVSCVPGSPASTALCTATVADTGDTLTAPTGTVGSWASDGSGAFYAHGTTTPATTCTLSSGSCTLDFVPALGSAQTQHITAGYGGDTYHAASDNTADPFQLSVVKPTVTIAADNQSIVYGGNDPAFTSTVSGLVGSDTLSTDAICSVAGAHRDVGTYPITCAGADAGGNYAISYTAGTLTIAKAVVVITPDSASIVYGDPEPALTSTVSGLVGSDALSTDASCGIAGAHGDVGTYPITCAGADAGGNYTISYGPATLTIAKAAGVITPDPQAITYGASDPVYGFTVSGLEPGDSLAGNPTCAVTGPHADAATYTISCFGGDAGGNYALNYHTAVLTVSKADLLVTADDQARSYGDPDPAFTSTVTGLVGRDMLNTNATCTVTGTHYDVGTYPITCATADAGSNYTISYHTAELTVRKADLHLTADDQTGRYGDPDPSFTYNTTGLIGNDQFATTATCTVTTGHLNVGTYPISCSGADAGSNYSVAYANGTLTVGTADLTVTAPSPNITYGPAASTVPFIPKVSGLVNGDTESSVGLNLPTCPPAVLPTLGGSYPAGSYPVTCTGSDALANYTIHYTDGILTVAKAVLAMAADNFTRPFGAPNPTFTAITSGYVNGDGPGIQYHAGVGGHPVLSTTAASSSPPGTYPITVSIGTLTSANYTFTLMPGTLTITRATQSISITSTLPAAPVVGETAQLSATGGASDNDVTFSADSSATACAVSGLTVSFEHAGTCVIDADQAGDSDYSAAPTAQQQVEVGKAAQAITFTSTPPLSAVSGGHYTVTAVGGGSSSPVVLSIGSATSAACSIVGPTVTFDHASTCTVNAAQAGDSDYSAAPTAQQLIAVSKIAQTVMFTSAGPGAAAAVVGASYSVTATGGASGNEVTYSVAGMTTNGACVLSGSTVTFVRAGLCVIAADQAGAGDYAVAPTAIEPVPVSPAATATSVSVTNASITAYVGVTSPGAGNPTGSVTFSVGGTAVGTAPVNGGIATLKYTVPVGAARTVAAVYSGDADFIGSSSSTSRRDPSITATISSMHAKSRYGWYRSAVTVSFHCVTNGAALTMPCPLAVTFTRTAAGQSITRTIAATNGGMATVAVRGINIDRVAPSVAVSGVTNGSTYGGAAPTAKCVGRDSLAGIASCTLTRRTSGTKTSYTALAVDKAGNTRSTSGSYTVLPIYIQGAVYKSGAFTVKVGHTYTMVVTGTGTRPVYYNAAVYPRTPSSRGHVFYSAGSRRWTLGVTITRSLRSHKYWTLGVKIGKTMHIVKIRLA